MVGSSQDAAGNLTKRSRKGRRLFFFALFALVWVVLILAAAGPALLSTGAGRGFVENIFNGRVAGSLSLEEIDLNWTKGQSVRGLVLRDAGGNPVLTMERMENDRSLWSLVRGRGRDLGTTTVRSLEAHIIEDEAGEVNIRAALAGKKDGDRDRPGAVPVLPFGTLHVLDSRIRVEAPGMEPVDFTLNELLLSLPAGGEPGSVKLEGTTRQGELAGDLKARGTIDNILDSRGRLQPLAARADITVEAGNLPVDGIDRAAGFRGQLAAALGRKLDLSVHTKAAAEGIGFDAIAVAPNLDANLKLALGSSGLKLNEEAKILFMLTEVFVQRAALLRDPESKLGLRESVPLDITLTELAVPLGAFDPSLTALRGRVRSRKDMRFTGLEKTGDLTVRSFTAGVESTDLASRIRADIFADLLVGSAAGKANLKGDFRNLFGAGGRFQPAAAEMELEGDFARLPTVLAAGFVDPPGLLRELLGETVDARIAARTAGQEGTGLDLALRSPNLEADAAFVLADPLRLTAPANLRARVTPVLVSMLMPEGAGGVDLLGPADLAMKVSRLELPGGEGEGPLFSREGSLLETTLSTPALKLGVAGFGAVELRDFTMAVSADTLEKLDLAADGTVSLPPDKGLITDLSGGRPLAVRLEGKGGRGADGKAKDVTAEVSLKNEGINAAAALAMKAPFEKLTLTSPLKMEWKASPAAVARLFKAPPEKTLTKGTTTIALDVEKLDLPLSPFTLAETAARAKLAVPKLEIAPEGGAEALLSDVKGSVGFDGAGNSIKASLAGMAAFSGDAKGRPINADLTLSDFLAGTDADWGKAKLALTVKGKAIPTSLLGIVSPGAAKLETYAGDRIDLETTISLDRISGGEGTAKIAAAAPLMKVDADLSIGEAVRLQKPAQFELTLTPESYKSLTSPPDKTAESRFSLAEKTRLKGWVEKLRWPRGGEKIGPVPAGVALEAGVSASGALFLDGKTGKNLVLEEISLSAGGSDLAKSVKLALESRISGEGVGGKAGSIKADLSLGDLFDKEGFNSDGFSMKGDIRTARLPVALLDEWLRLGRMGEAALGENLDLTAAVDLKRGNGPVAMSLAATHARADLKGAVKDGVFRLQQPLTGQLDVTDDLGSLLLAKVHPLFKTVTTSREPLRLEVPTEGFYLPVKDFGIEKVKVPRMKLATNRLMLKKGGVLQFLIPLAKTFGGMSGLGAGTTTEVWFTDLNARLENGIFSYDNRLDLLIDERLHAVSWGTVALGKAEGKEGKSAYSLKLGLPADALRRILGTKRISEGEVLVIPLEGAEDGLDLKATFAKAGLDLGRVRGQYEIARQNPLGGLVAGTLVKKVIGTDTGGVPPPSMTPLPWAGLLPPLPEEPEPEPAAPAESATGEEPAKAPPEKKPETPEDVIKEVLPEELKGVIDIFKKR